MQQRVTGIGGIFFKAAEPDKLREWYQKHLGIRCEPWGGSVFKWSSADGSGKPGKTVWSIFPKSTAYFKQSRADWMLNYRVENLDELLDALARDGVEVDSERENSEFGKFAWISDPEGNRIELWEPAPGL